MMLPQISKLISSSELTSHEKSLENEKPEFQSFAKNFGPKFRQNSWRAHFAQKKDTVPGLDLKEFKCAPANFFLGDAIWRRDV